MSARKDISSSTLNSIPSYRDVATADALLKILLKQVQDKPAGKISETITDKPRFNFLARRTGLNYRQLAQMTGSELLDLIREASRNKTHKKKPTTASARRAPKYNRHKVEAIHYDVSRAAYSRHPHFSPRISV